MPLKNGTYLQPPLCNYDANDLSSSDAFPSSEAFDLIHSSLQSNEADRKDAIQKGNAIYAFTLKNKEGQTSSWHIDLKEKGGVASEEAPPGKKADGEFPGFTAALDEAPRAGDCRNMGV